MTRAIKEVEFPEKLQILVGKSRYKVLYGGRGGSKSWGVATYLVLRACEKKELILCVRELQKSIKDSSHRLLKKTIGRLGLTDIFDITKTSIKHKLNGSEFIFEGIRDNIQAIKSAEGITLCWIEEAQFMSADSYEILTPTIRSDDSEVIITFNPDYEEDATYQKFVVSPPDNAAVVLVNYYDNPWFPEVLEIERLADKGRLDQDAYNHKWLGMCKGTGGKVYPTFSKEAHVKSFEREVIRDRAECFMAMDPAQHYYSFCLWMAIIKINDRGRWPEDYHRHIYAEWPTYEDLGGWYWENRKKRHYTGTIADMGKEIYARDGAEYGYRVLGRYIDSRYASGTGSWSWYGGTEGIIEQFAKPKNGGLIFQCPPVKIIDSQRDVIKEDMAYNRDVPLSPFNQPSFSIDPSCKNLINSMENHRLEQETERESERHKDACDTLRILYAGVHNHRPRKPKKDPDEYGAYQPHRRGLIPRGIY